MAPPADVSSTIRSSSASIAAWRSEPAAGMYDDESSRLVVKLPRDRVLELIETGTGEPFAPAGKVFREWVSITTVDRSLWQRLLAEAVGFAREQLDP